MKKILSIFTLVIFSFSSIAFAKGFSAPTQASLNASFEQGVYIGIAGGFGKPNWGNIDGNGVTVDHDGNAEGRILLGYDINRYFAIEAGYTYFFLGKPRWLQNGTEIDKIKTTYAIDLVGKIKAPIVNAFDLYCKIGVNYFVSQPESLNGSSRQHGNVVFGVGADYYITPKLVANAEWMRFGGKAKIGNPIAKQSDYQPDADAFMIGLRYKFDY